MGRLAVIVLVATLVTGLVFAQPQLGRVDVTVHSPDGSLVTGAVVSLVQTNAVADLNFLKAITTSGAVTFNSVPVGNYSVTAMKMGEGFAASTVEVLANGMSTVSCTLSGRKTGSATCDSLAETVLRGRAIVADPDVDHNASRYWLDVNNDGTKDFRLIFGPPSYVPPSGVLWPVNGDEIEVNAGLFSYGCDSTNDAPMVLVFTLNGQLWRASGNGGSGGERRFGIRHCDGAMNDVDPVLVPSLPRTELLGSFMFPFCEPDPPNPPGIEYFLDVAETQVSYSHYLNLGTGTSDRWWNYPFQTTSIIGTLLSVPDATTPWAIVYEVCGRFIREPGDTTALATSAANNVSGPVHIGEPSSYLTVRNYPNPFNPTTTIRYSVPQSGDVTLKVFDITGREVATLVNAFQRSGEYAVAWNASGSSSGVYFVRLSAGNDVFTNRTVLLK